MKKTLLIVIDNLTKGGAEVMLVGLLRELNTKFSIILVTLNDKNHFPVKDVLCEKKYTLGFNNKMSIIPCVFKLKQIINAHNPSLIHSHLFYSSLIARIACPLNTPLIYTLHNEMSKSVFNNSKAFALLEKLTIKKNHGVIAVSNEVLRDYERSIKKNNCCSVLPNYISDIFFNEKRVKKDLLNLQKIKLIAVGNVKDQKNYLYLIQSFNFIKDYNVSIDIYGRGNEKDIQFLKNKVDQDNLPINFKGPANNIEEILPLYDMFVCCSKYEGFGIAPIEAMASGLPLLLSDLPVFREVTFGNALFFDIEDPLSLAFLIKEIFEGKHDVNYLSDKGISLSKKYTKNVYLDNLFILYDKMLNDSNNSN